MSFLNMPIALPWTLRFPRVTRYLEEQYVAEFFESGRLRMSSLQTFRQHPDEVLRDEWEGRRLVEVPGSVPALIAPDGDFPPAFVLCGSMLESQAQALRFEKKSGICVLDPLAFGQYIARYIPGFYVGLQGPIDYAPRKIIRARIDGDSLAPRSGEPIEDWMRRSQGEIGNQQLDSVFFKEERFAADVEYRWVWAYSGVRSEHIHLELDPKVVRKLCRPLCE